MLEHEVAARGKDLDKVKQFPLTIVGCGASGSNLAYTLAKQGFENISVIDFDKVEDRNIGTQVYGIEDISMFKTKALYNAVYYASGVGIKDFSATLKADNASKLLKGAELVVDCLDNAEARQVLFDFGNQSKTTVIHAGFNGGFGEIKFNEKYLVPEPGGEEICDYPLARNFITLTVSLLAEVIFRYIARGERLNYNLTFNDLKLHSM